MQLDRALDPAQGRIDRLSSRPAAGKIRNRGAPIAVYLFVDPHQVLPLHDFFPRVSPACRIIDAS
jgi:hypothetical protein